MKMINLKFTLIFLFVLSTSGNCFAQTDITKLTSLQWQEDLDTLVAKGNRIFAGFTDETKMLFNNEAKKIREAIPSLKSTSIALAFTRLLALLNDGHTELSFRTPAFLYLPLRLYYYQDAVFITGVSKEHEDILGARLVEIEGVSITEIIERLKPYINRDNEMEYLLTAPVFMTIPKILEEIGVGKDTNQVTLSLQLENGSSIQRAIEKLTLSERREIGRLVSVQSTVPLYLKEPRTQYWYEYLPEPRVMFVKLGFISNQRNKPPMADFFNQLFEEIDKQKPDKLVIDFRTSRGGNYHRSRPLIEGIRARPFINQKGKVFVVHNRLTFSAGATTSLFLKDNTEALIIGETSRSRPNYSDNAEFFNLPHSKLQYGFTNRLGVHSPRLGQTDRIPIDIPIEPTFKYFKSGRDEVLEYIISLK